MWPVPPLYLIHDYYKAAAVILCSRNASQEVGDVTTSYLSHQFQIFKLVHPLITMNQLRTVITGFLTKKCVF